METDNVMIDKLKESVISKLEELDPNNKYDCTLIDYILVMVVNQKSKYEMKHNLALFLGKISDDFVNWLFDHLSYLKNNTGNNEKPDDQNISENGKQRKSEEKENPTHPNTQSIEKNGKTVSEIKSDDVAVEPLKERVKSKRKLKSAVINLTNSLDSEENENKRKRTENNEINQKPKRQRSVLISSEQESLEEQVKPEVVEPPKLSTIDKETKFFVTLDGVKNMYKGRDWSAKIDEDISLMDEELDPELMKEDLSNLDHLGSRKDKLKDSQSNRIERCRYWPSCMNGNKCDYYHPVIKCNLFPHCRFGDKCLYIHPICKFDSLCSRKDCPFFHQSSNKRSMMMMNNNINVPCKFFPNCVNPNCEFIHPKTCHFGTTCKTFNCPYIHPSQNLPHPSQLKWSSKNKPIEIK